MYYVVCITHELEGDVACNFNHLTEIEGLLKVTGYKIFTANIKLPLFYRALH